jgi:peptidoglycan/LPS O-acetylase OafA/YrhL
VSTAPADIASPVTRTRTVPALTGIRFFAAVYVFVFHFGATALDKAAVARPIATFLHNGSFGVSAFFVLSGFILAHAHPGQFDQPGSYRSYLLSRFARIYPVYFLALLLSLPLVFHDLTPASAAATLFMVQAWGNAFSTLSWDWVQQTWTLSVELVFYLLFPFLVTRLRRASTPVLLGLWLLDVACLVAGGISVIAPGTDDADRHGIPAWLLRVPMPLPKLAEFILGILLHTLVRRTPGIAQLQGALWPLGVLAAIVLLLSSTDDARVISLATVLVGVLIALLYGSDNAFTALLGSRALVVLGSASYALYLLQQPCHEYLRLYLLPDPYGRFFALPFSVAVSVLVWHFVEEPARRTIVRLRPAGRRMRHIPGSGGEPS